MIGELTYNELLYSPDLVEAVKGLTDADLCAALEHLQAGCEKGWPAQRVQGVCILDASRRFEERIGCQESGVGNQARMEEPVINISITFDRCHGSEVAE